MGILEPKPQTVAGLDAAVTAKINDTASASRAALNATYASNKQVAAVTTPPVLLDATTTTNAGTTPRFIEYFDGYMWGVYTGDIYRSSDEGVTWSLYCNSWPGVGAEAFISRLVKTSDGEVLAMSDHEIRKSTGWANGNAATWSAKKVTNTGTGIFNGFGLDGDGTKFILVEYSPTPASWGDSRYGYISLDSGNTWTARYDSLALHGATANANSHLHGACYDATSGRFYVGEGHGTAGGVYYSADNGLTWAVAPGMRISEGGGNYNAPTVITATDDGLVMGSDNGKNGLFGVVRQTDPMKEVAVQTWTMQTGRDGLVTFAQRGWRDPATGLVYVTFRAEYNDTRPSIAAGTAKAGGLVYEWPTLPSVGGSDRFYIAAVTAPSRLTAYAEISNNPTTVRGHLAAAVTDPGKLRGGRSSAPNAVAVGPGAVASGATSTATGTGSSATGIEATVYGAGATSAANAGTALGRLASASEAGTAVGRGANAGSDGTVAGYGASTTGLNGSAFGVLAKAGVDGTAVGHTADASGFSNGVALGKGTVTSAADQVAVGDRDIEIQSLTKGLIIKSPDGARWRIRVANGGTLTITAA